MEDTQWVPGLTSPVIMDTPDLDPAQGLVRHQETGINELQHAIEVRK